MRPSGIITLLTDFGTRDACVGIMKGVALGICPAARLVDLTHEVPPQAVVLGAWVLRSAVDAFPHGTVHLAVVDPGVGSTRAPVAVVTARAILVGPDNGLLAPSAAHLGVRAVYRLETASYFRQPVSQTFHGRDIFAPVAAHLAAGVDPSALGPLATLQEMALAAPSQAGGALHGEVVYVDRFGNLVTNIPAAALRTFRASSVSVTIAGMTITGLMSSYAAAAPAAPLAIIGSWDLLEVAVREGDAAARLQVGLGAPVAVTVG